MKIAAHIICEHSCGVHCLVAAIQLGVESLAALSYRYFALRPVRCDPRSDRDRRALCLLLLMLTRINALVPVGLERKLTVVVKGYLSPFSGFHRVGV